ncbi:hypothetical protein Tco_0388558 [Tanacetum coccineum]
MENVNPPPTSCGGVHEIDQRAPELQFDDEMVDTPLVSPFLPSDNDSGDEEVLNELIDYENAGTVEHYAEKE